MYRLLLFSCLILGSFRLPAQRSYANRSVLAGGSWYQLGVTQPGIYRISGAQLQSMGFSLPLNSAAIRLFGRLPGPLPESAAAVSPAWSDDLTELAIWVDDGGDGLLQAADFLLFYAAGPHAWRPASSGIPESGVRPVPDIYSDTAYYYITAGDPGGSGGSGGSGGGQFPGLAGKRIDTVPASGTATHTVTEFRYRYWHEQDLFNLLSSGQEWLGERFLAEAAQPQSFSVPLRALVPGRPVHIESMVVARSVGSPATMEINAAGTTIATHTIAPVGASAFDLFAREDLLSADFTPPGTGASGLSLQYRFGSANSAAIGWLNRFIIGADCQLAWAGEPFAFRSEQGAAAAQIASYQLSNGMNRLRVWKISDPLQPREMSTSFNQNVLSFTDLHERPEEYFVFDPAANLPSPAFLRSVPNQNLHGATAADYLIIAAPGLLAAAERLAGWHRQRSGLSTLVVPVEQIWHEFSAGRPDPTAIRDFVKMFYDRSGGNSAMRPRYLLLFGHSSFDPRKRILTQSPGIPSYQSKFYLDPLSTYVSDDYFGFLDDGEDINGSLQGNQLDIAIGRIPAQDLSSAQAYVDKIIAYHHRDSRGAWRNELSFIADDEDHNLHLQDMEGITALAAETNQAFLHHKIYLDAYTQESDAAGSRYPQVNQAISSQMQKGTLIWNYAGHGGFRRLADEVILDREIVDGWQQNGRLPLFVTATCDFAPFDNPASASLGEYLLLKPGAGAIALMTTTRLVFAYSNRLLNANYMKAALERLPDGRYRTLGEAALQAKNNTYASSGDLFNNLKFTLLGDPALTLAFPRHQVITTHIDGKPVSAGLDSLQALREVTVEGQVADGSGAILSDFNGWIFPLVLDQPYQKQTLANDPASQVMRFTVQDRVIFRGQSPVVNGRFRFSFFIPRDVNYQDAAIRINYYAMDSLTDAQGAFTELRIAGSAPVPADTAGPQIRAALNDWSFHPGGTVNDRPVLLLHLEDGSGINLVGAGFGHDITLVIDEKEELSYNLNPFFEADPDTYTSGTVRFELPSLPAGQHTLTIKAWDPLNNSSQLVLPFRIRAGASLALEELAAWPNPSRGNVKFVFSHSRLSGPLEAQLELFTVQGQRVKLISGTIIASGNRSYLEWDGRSDQGLPVLPGTYVYRLILRLPDGKTVAGSRQLIRL